MFSATLLISTCTPPTPSSNPSSLTLYNLSPPSQLNSFKRTSIPPNSLGQTSNHIFAAQTGSALVHVYNREKFSLETTVPFSEQLTSLCVSPDGAYCVGGNERGQIALWELATGQFLRTSSYHNQRVSHLAFTADSNFLISSSPDSTINVWPILSILTPETTVPKPLFTITTHTRSVTALLPSHSTQGPTAFVLSAAEDCVVLLTSLFTRKPLRTFVFDEPASSLALDPLDRAIYAGFPSGKIVSLDLLSLPDVPPSQPIYVSSTTKFARWFTVPPAKEGSTEDRGISALQVSYDGTKIYSGSAVGEVLEWDSAVGIVRRKIVDMKAPITGLMLETQVPGLEKEEKLRITSITKPKFHQGREEPFSRTVSVEFPSHLSPLPAPPSAVDLISAGLSQIQEWGTAKSTSAKGTNERVRELEEEVERWKAVVKEGQAVRDKIWKGYVELALEKGVDVDGVAEGDGEIDMNGDEVKSTTGKGKKKKGGR